MATTCTNAALSLLALVLCLAAAGCGVYHVDFAPREHAQAESPEGRTAALYELTADGKPIGEVRVWSDGARLEDDESTSVHVGFEIENRSTGVIALDATEVRLTQLRAYDRTLPDVLEPELQGDPAVNGHGISRVDLRFRLPPEVESPGDVQSFAVAWTIREPDDDTYRQVTPFRREYRSYDSSGYWYGHYRFGYWYPYWCW